MNTSYSTGQCSSVSRRFFGWWCGGRCQDLWQEEQPLYDILQSQLSLAKRKREWDYLQFTIGYLYIQWWLKLIMCKGLFDMFPGCLGNEAKSTTYTQAVNRFIACVILSLLRENAKATQWLSCWSTGRWQLRRCSQQIQKDIYVVFKLSSIMM